MFRKYTPKSLYLRILLIVVLPIFLMQSVVTYIFFARHWDRVSANLSNNVAGQIALITRSFLDDPDPDIRARLSDWVKDDLQIEMRFEPGGVIPEKDRLDRFNVYNVVLSNRLERRIGYPHSFDNRSWQGRIEVRVQLSDGYLQFLVPSERAFATTGPIFLFWLFGTSILLGCVAVVFMRNQVRSILRLAHAAEAFGRGRDAPDFRPSGATEVRKAGYAFIAMRERIKRHLEQRTSMLAGVSHDLRTPLTRIKLGLAMEKDTPEIEALRGDVLEMERMVEAYLDFARNEAVDEEPETIDIVDVVREVAENAARDGREVHLDAPPEAFAPARRIAVKRALSNLIGNALRYGERSWITIEVNDRRVRIIVEDDGPGIAEKHHEQVFRPFTRLEETEAAEGASVGMGLTVVQNVARSHGGTVKLARSAHGGLAATIDLPR